MNDLCVNCDTRIRLKLCNGQSGNFKFCFRQVGSIGNVPRTITPFNTLDELYETNTVLHDVIRETLHLDSREYDTGSNLVLCFGLWKNDPTNQKMKADNRYYPIGFVTVPKDYKWGKEVWITT